MQLKIYRGNGMNKVDYQNTYNFDQFTDIQQKEELERLSAEREVLMKKVSCWISDLSM